MTIHQLRFMIIVWILSSSTTQQLHAQYNVTQASITLPYGLKVNTFNGNLTYAQNDLSIPSTGMDIDLTLHYNSNRCQNNFGCGPGWASNYNMVYRVHAFTGNYILERGNGQRHTYTTSNGNYDPSVGHFETFSEYEAGKFILTKREGKKYFFDNSSHQKLTRIEDLNDNTITMNYNGNNELTYIQSSCGSIITFTWTDGNMTQINDASNVPTRIYQYEYTDNLLTKYTDPEGYIESYEYNNHAKMTKLTNKRGHSIDLTYNNLGAVATATTSLNQYTMTFDMNNMETMIEELVDGTTQTTTYKYNANKQITQKTGNCCGFDTQYEYDSNNNLTKVTDANGNISQYEYNLLGQITKETDALGYYNEYTYGTTFNLLTQERNKNGETTTSSYDNNGNMTQQTTPSYVVQYSYNPDGTQNTSTDGNNNGTIYNYAPCGQLESMTDALGHTTSYIYNNRGELESETDDRGCTTAYTYDGLGRVRTMIDPANETMTYTYDGNGNQVTVTDKRGFVTTYEYDALNRMTAMHQPLNISTLYAYNEKNRISMTDPKGNVTTYFYNNQNLLITEVDALGNTVNFTYDSKGNRLTATDAIGNTTTYEYDDIDQLIKITNALGEETNYTYDPNGNQITMTDALSNVTTSSYDASDRRIQVSDALNGVTTFAYDDNNNQTQVTDANGNTTTSEYDVLDRLTKITNALGGEMTYTYDNVGNQLTSTDVNNNTTHQTYDCLNRLVSSTNAENESITYVYDANSNQIQVNYPNGNTVLMAYDALNRPISSSDNIGSITNITYDLNSNTVSQTDGNGNSTSLAYDEINRVISQTDALGESNTMIYNENSNVLSQTDRNGNTTAFEYDALNRRIKTTDALNNETLSTYDAVGNLAQLEDANNNTTTYTYDALYRNTVETFADGTSKSYTYDAVGNMTQRIDNNGDATAYTYDVLYRLTLRDYPTGNDDSFSYDAGGRMLTAKNYSDVIITYTYDNANRTLSEENYNGQTTTYGYDIPNSKRTLTYPSGRVIEENYDQRGRLDIIKEGATNISDFDYDVGNRITQKSYANGTTSTHAYNDNNWITQLTHNNGSNFADFEYMHDKEGNKQYAKHNHKTDHSEQYAYDAIYRLTTYKKGTLASDNIPSPTTQTAYNFDALGNWTNVNTDGNPSVYTANNMNEYTAITNPTTNPTYDANGNLTSDGINIYTYDYENRLTGMDAPNYCMTYYYDALGRRLAKEKESNHITDFFIVYYYDGARAIEEQDLSTTTTIATYVYGTWIDDILSMTRNDTTYYHHHNALGSVIALTDDAGNVSERYEYNAYGQPTFYDNNYATLDTSLVGNPYLFTARRWDQESGLYYYRARMYHPVLGRFMQRDPLGYVDGMNVLAYVGGNGVNWLDPWGLSTWTSKKKKKGTRMTSIWGDGRWKKKGLGYTQHYYWKTFGEQTFYDETFENDDIRAWDEERKRCFSYKVTIEFVEEKEIFEEFIYTTNIKKGMNVTGNIFKFAGTIKKIEGGITFVAGRVMTVTPATLAAPAVMAKGGIQIATGRALNSVGTEIKTAAGRLPRTGGSSRKITKGTKNPWYIEKSAKASYKELILKDTKEKCCEGAFRMYKYKESIYFPLSKGKNIKVRVVE